MAGVIVADASWILALRDPLDAHHGAAIVLRRKLAEQRLALAPLTLAECLVAAVRMGVGDEAERALRAAFDVVPDDESAPMRWATRRVVAGLPLPDAVVLEAAVRQGADGIATFDKRLAAAARKAGIRVYR